MDWKPVVMYECPHCGELSEAQDKFCDECTEPVGESVVPKIPNDKEAWLDNLLFEEKFVKEQQEELRSILEGAYQYSMLDEFVKQLIEKTKLKYNGICGICYDYLDDEAIQANRAETRVKLPTVDLVKERKKIIIEVIAILATGWNNFFDDEVVSENEFRPIDAFYKSIIDKINSRWSV